MAVITICDFCGTQDAEWCWKHRRDECENCADTCAAGGELEVTT